ncbi:hypothetical protein R3W88_023227 [Solanum pinnatisectum]|uniref:Uncharacterized protein n=1 Tax=Solanum pinnatisectum TaxID=50273 RepID=A0AAV9LWV8_9SOLN|nr:hypothetical protein R3W88_023227 [Solanum pinnatisectum]
MCESVTNGLPTSHWFDTGQHVSLFIPFVLRIMKYCHHLSATEFDKNSYRPIIRVQGSGILIFAIRCSSYYNSKDDSKIAWEGLLTIDFSRCNSKMDQVLDAMSLLGVVLVKTPEETGTVQQFHLKDRACFLISFGGRDCIVPAAHSAHALPMRYFDVNSFFCVLSRQKSDLVASKDINDVKHVKFNEGIRHAECLFHVDPGVNLFMVKLGGMVKVNCVWDPGINSNIMHRNDRIETIDAHLFLEFIVTISLLFNYFYDSHLKGNTQTTKRRKTTLKRLFVFPYLWLSLSHDSGWQVLLDVYALGAKDMPMLSAKTSSQLVSRDLILFGTNSLFLAVLKITMSLKEPLGAWGEKN